MIPHPTPRASVPLPDSPPAAEPVVEAPEAPEDVAAVAAVSDVSAEAVAPEDVAEIDAAVEDVADAPPAANADVAVAPNELRAFAPAAGEDVAAAPDELAAVEPAADEDVAAVADHAPAAHPAALQHVVDTPQGPEAHPAAPPAADVVRSARAAAVQHAIDTRQGLEAVAAVPPAADDVQPVEPVADEDVAAADDLQAVEEPVADEDVAALATADDGNVVDQVAATVSSATALPVTPAAPSADWIASAAETRRSSEGFYATAFIPSGLPRSTDLSLPSSPTDVREFIRQAALERNIDPDIAVRVVLSEGGLTPATWTGDHGSSFGPLQLHYGAMAPGGNAVTGLGDTFSAETRLQASDLSTWRQQVEWALDRAAQNGWTPWHGAAAAGISTFDGIGVVAPRSDNRFGPTTAAGGRRYLEVPNQFAAQLSPQEAYAACGPVAAVAVARFLGRNPTVIEALDRARLTGWTANGGMNGIANEKRLLDSMHIASVMETPLSWKHVQIEASHGTPVIVSTPNHYWVVDDYDPLTREYHVGQSGLVFRGGAEWMTADRIVQLGGGANGALYIDHPLAVQPSLPITPVAYDLAPAAAPTIELRSERWWEDTRPEKRSDLRPSASWA